jgi:hypothetical protein
MATDFPIDPEFGRFIQGVGDEEGQQPEEGEEVPLEEELDLMEPEIEELPDGSAIVREPDTGPLEDEEFYKNLADDMDMLDMSSLALKYTEMVENDRKARENRDKQYEDGLRRTGMGNDAPGGANFQGASKVVHPVMAEACVDFAARAIKEMFPPDGPTRTKILGDVRPEKVATAERKRDFMNWQLTEQIEEFRDEQEQMLTQLPLGGSQYIKLYYDEQKRRPVAEFLPIDNMILPFSAANFYTAQRATEQQDITEMEYKRRISSGLYRDVRYIKATMEPEETKAQKANNKIEGVQNEENQDGMRRVYHIYTWLELEDDPETKGELAPYILMIDDLENEVLGLYRNWDEGDESMTKLDWIVEYKFIPWRGAYAIGLPHLIGGLSAALTGALRALLDSAHINNAATLLKLKGAKISGQSQNVEVTQVAEIEGAPGVDDIRKLAMPMPFNPPSGVLMELLGWLTDAAKGVVSTSEEKIADITSQAPVGTTQALIEQGAAVYSSIHARLHESQGRMLKILGRINRWYLKDMRIGEVVKDLDIKQDDFEKTTDVIPVSDPHIFSETQRMAQTQAVMAMMKEYPQFFNESAVIQRFLKQIKVPEVNELMKDVPAPEKQDAANENVAMTVGQAASAYPEQDHLGHIQAHLDYAKDPIFGSNPLVAPVFIPKVMAHIREHLALWYLGRMNGYVSQSLNRQPDEYKLLDDPVPLDRLYGAASQLVMDDSEKTFSKMLPVVQQIMKSLDQFKPKPELTPDGQVLLQTSMAETDRRKARDAAEMALKGKDLDSKTALGQQKLQLQSTKDKEELELQLAIATGDNETRERIETARLAKDAAEMRQRQATPPMPTKGE